VTSVQVPSSKVFNHSWPMSKVVKHLTIMFLVSEVVRCKHVRMLQGMIFCVFFTLIKVQRLIKIPYKPPINSLINHSQTISINLHFFIYISKRFDPIFTKKISYHQHSALNTATLLICSVESSCPLLRITLIFVVVRCVKTIFHNHQTW